MRTRKAVPEHARIWDSLSSDVATTAPLQCSFDIQPDSGIRGLRQIEKRTIEGPPSIRIALRCYEELPKYLCESAVERGLADPQQVCGCEFVALGLS